DRAGWLGPEWPETHLLMTDVLKGVAEIFPSPYIHIGGDEPYGMPHDLYSSYIAEVRRLVRSLGRRPVGWQESARAGLATDDIIQYWFTDLGLPDSVPAEVRESVEADLALSRRDIEAAEAASAPVIVSPVSHCYLDVPYRDAPEDDAQADRQRKLGLRFYPRKTVEQSFGWEPAEALGAGRGALVAGVEAAFWAESIANFDDVTFLLLPRLPGVAQRAWSQPEVTTWSDHRDRLAWHAGLWEQDDLTYFRASTIDWR